MINYLRTQQKIDSISPGSLERALPYVPVRSHCHPPFTTKFNTERLRANITKVCFGRDCVLTLTMRSECKEYKSVFSLIYNISLLQIFNLLNQMYYYCRQNYSLFHSVSGKINSKPNVTCVYTLC